MNNLKTLALIVLVLSGCSTSKTMNGIMSSWTGSHINEVISQWGYPTEETAFQGNTLYIWHHNKSAYIPSSTTTTGSVHGNSIYAQSNTTGGHTFHGSCQRILEVNRSGIVIRSQWRGNNCPFGELMEYSNWRKKS